MKNPRSAGDWETLVTQPAQAASLAKRHLLQRPSLMLAAAYAGLGSAWIAFSDRLLLSLSSDASVYSAASQGKGFAFVLATSMLIYALASRGPWQRSPASEAPDKSKPGGIPLSWLFAGLTVLIAAAGFLALAQSARHAREQRVEQLQGLAAMRADALAAWIGRRKSDGIAILGDPTLQAGYQQWRRLAAEPSLRWREELNSRLLAARFQHAWLLGADGSLLLSRGKSHPALDAGKLRQQLQATLAGRAIRVENASWQNGPDTSTFQVDVLLPLFGLPGEADAVLMLRAELPLLSAPIGASGIQLRLEPRKETKAPGSQGTGLDSHDGFDESGRAVLRVAEPIAGSEWQVVALMPSHAVDADGLEQLGWLALVDLIALVMAAALVYGLRQRRELRSTRRERDDLHDQVRGWQLLESIANSSSDAIYAKDREGNYLFVNKETCRLLGKSREELLNSDLRSVFPPEQAERIAAAEQQAMLSIRPISTEATLTTSDGDRSYLSTKGPLLDKAGRLLGSFGLSRDITERKRNEERHRQWAMAFENIRDGVMITDARCRIQAVNPAFTDITGYTAQDAIGASPRLLQSGRQGPEFYSQMWSMIQETGCWRGEIWNRRKTGEVYPEWMTISAVCDELGKPTHYVGVFTDVTRVKSDEAKLERLKNFDPLTELPNRGLLLERIGGALVRARRSASRTGVMVIDLDGFKTVNDSLGHPAGDELLVCIAARLKTCMRPQDLLGRLGGDEFLVMLEGLEHAADAAALAQELLAAIAAPVPLACGQHAYVTASIGISIHPDDGDVGAIELLRDADTAMYRAKELGRNRCCYYTSDMNAQAISRLELEAALSQALERQELLLHYQPKVDLRSGVVVGAEALLRWRRRDGDLVPPGKFIPIAEQSSLILEIGAWVIDEACRQIRAWQDEGRPLVRLAVNVAARQFAAGDLDQVVSGALARHGVDAQWLEVELTEGMLVTDPQAAIAMMQRLQQLGVKLSLDDFGTGFSSLAYLQKFPIDSLKIDQSFVRDIGREPDGAALVDSVIALAHRFHLRVVAEGVETAAQHDYLLGQGCDEVQGYFFGRPAPAEALQALLESAATV